jgi:putative ABC transport system permease protein
MIQQLPLSRNRWSRRMLAEGTHYSDPKQGLESNYGIVAPGYFHALQIPLLRGRDFTVTDDTTQQRVAIVNQSLARKLWPGQDPIGHRVRFTGDPDSIGWATVVGEVGDVLQNFDERETRFHIFVPHDQTPNQMMSLIVNSPLPPGALAQKIRDRIHSHDPDLAFVDVRTMDEHIAFSMWLSRLFMGLFTFFAALALLIAAVGLYGVMSYSVAQRTQEIGIRMALGADRQRVVGLVVGQATQLLLIGCGIGLAGAWGLTRVMAAMLFGVSPSDPPTFAGVALILAATGMVAAWVPAQRATRVDPMVALRTE